MRHITQQSVKSFHQGGGPIFHFRSQSDNADIVTDICLVHHRFDRAHTTKG